MEARAIPQSEFAGLRAEFVRVGLGNQELVPPAVVAVVVRVHHPARGPSPDARVGLDHLPRVGQVPEGVDDEAAGPVHEPRVAGPEAALLLEAGVDVARDLTQLHAVPDDTVTPCAAV